MDKQLKGGNCIFAYIFLQCSNKEVKKCWWFLQKAAGGQRTRTSNGDKQLGTGETSRVRQSLSEGRYYLQHGNHIGGGCGRLLVSIQH